MPVPSILPDDLNARASGQLSEAIRHRDEPDAVIRAIVAHGEAMLAVASAIVYVGNVIEQNRK